VARQEILALTGALSFAKLTPHCSTLARIKPRERPKRLAVSLKNSSKESRKMRRLVAIICLFFSLTVAVCPQNRSRAWLNGSWEGTGYQMDTDSTWTMSFKAQGKRFWIEYPSLNCAGTWRLIRVNSRRAIFRERITSGREACVDQGMVTIERLNGRQLAYRFSHAGTTQVSASAILNRKK
jgi:hypothetical protein